MGDAVEVGAWDGRGMSPAERKYMHRVFMKGARFIEAENYVSCLACNVMSRVIDRDTHLCRGCWRAWRWSTKMEMP